MPFLADPRDEFFENGIRKNVSSRAGVRVEEVGDLVQVVHELGRETAPSAVPLERVVHDFLQELAAVHVDTVGVAVVLIHRELSSKLLQVGEVLHD